MITGRQADRCRRTTGSGSLPVSLWLTVLVALFVSGCATEPPAAPEPEPVPVTAAPEPAPAPEPVPPAKPAEPEISKDRIASLHEETLALRKEAFGLGLQDLLADGYSTAEKSYVAGKEAMDADDRKAALDLLGTAKDSFAELLAKGGVMVAGNLATEAEAMRNLALKAGAESLTDILLATTDELAASAARALDDGDWRKAIPLWRDASGGYDVTEKSARAMTVRQKIDGLAFGPLDAGNYELAVRKLDAAGSLVPSDIQTARDNADEALLRFNLVLSRGWELTAGKRRDDADRYRRDSDSIKAQVAVRAAYTEAFLVWTEAETALERGNHEDSVPLYVKAEQLFNDVFATASAKRDAALAAMAMAGGKTEESARIAREADERLSGAPLPATLPDTAVPDDGTGPAPGGASEPQTTDDAQSSPVSSPDTGPAPVPDSQPTSDSEPSPLSTPAGAPVDTPEDTPAGAPTGDTTETGITEEGGA